MAGAIRNFGGCRVWLHFRVAIVGDVGEAVARSEAFADYVVESNRGADVWFVAAEAELEARLAALP